MDNNIKLRVATQKDALELLNIYSYYVKNTAVTYEWEIPSLEEFSNRISEKLEKYPYIVAEKQEDGKSEIIGYAYASPFRTRAAYAWCVETSIYVKKEFRHCGIGKKLLLKLEELLKNQNVLNIYAGISYNEKEDEYLNYDSINFHTKMGYKKVAHYNKCGYKFGRWYDIVFMEKNIGDHPENPEKIKFWNYKKEL